MIQNKWHNMILDAFYIRLIQNRKAKHKLPGKQYKTRMIQNFTPRRIFIFFVKLGLGLVFLFQILLIFIPKIFFRTIKFSFSGRHRNPFKAAGDVLKHQCDVVKLEGYQIEEYQFQTKDHAFVSFWRVNKEIAKNDDTEEDSDRTQEKRHYIDRIYGEPIIVQHGLIDSSITWFMQEQKANCLPFVLAEAGYDVWVGNNRGTKFSNRGSHKPGYWDYTLDHIVQHDFPALIEGVLRVTGKKQLTYIGHSQGTFQFFTGLGIDPKLKYRIKLFIGLGPVIGINHLQNHLLMKIFSKINLISVLKIMGFNAMLIPSWMSKLIGVLIYNCSVYMRGAYQVFVWVTGQPQKPKIDINRLGFFLTHQPGGASINNLYHWTQCYKRAKMGKFDYGPKRNHQLYGTYTPPQYTYSHLKYLPFDCVLFRGTKDVIVSEKDFAFLTESLDSQRTKILNLEDYAHLDYLWSENANQDIYQQILVQLSKVQQKRFNSMEDIFQ